MKIPHFTAQVNAEFWAQCDDLKETEQVSLIQPTYPSTSHANHEQGRAILYALLEADGSLSHLTIIRRATPDLEAAEIEAVRHWHYKPAPCGQPTTRYESSLRQAFVIRC